MSDNSTKDIGWKNLDSGMSDYGSTPPGEMFKKSAALVRETVQNSLDARDKEKNEPVEIDFEYLFLDGVDSLPGFSSYKNRVLERDRERNRVQNNRWLTEIDNLIKQKRDGWRVLRIGDHNTTGLDYDAESSNSCTWHKLVRAQNSSSKVGQEGGSFGLGSGAHSVASLLYLVFYGSRSRKTGKYRFQGVAHLGAIVNSNEPDRYYDSRIFYGKGDGGYIPCDEEPKGFPGRSSRDYGTDVFIVEPREVESFLTRESTESIALKRLVWQFVYNFAPAIKAGEVRARFLQNGKDLLDISCSKKAAEFLLEITKLDEDEKRGVFSEGCFDCEQSSAKFLIKYFQNELEKEPVKIGEEKVAELFLYQDKEKTSITYAARKIGMRVETPWAPYRFGNQGRVSWLVYISNANYNSKLRELESPDHLSWTKTKSEASDEAVKKRDYLRAAVRDKIQKYIERSISEDGIDVTDIEGLMAWDSGGQLVQTDLKMKPLRIQSWRSGAAPGSGPSVKKKGTGTAAEPSPQKKKSITKNQYRTGTTGGDEEVMHPVAVRDRIVALKPRDGLYKIKFRTGDYSEMRLDLEFIPDDARIQKGNGNENLAVQLKEVVNTDGCKAEIVNGSLITSMFKPDSDVKLTIRIDELQMTSLRVKYYAK